MKVGGEDEGRHKKNGRTPLGKKPKLPAEVCPPVRLRAYPDHRAVADRLPGVAHRHPFGDRRGAIARGNEFAALAGWGAPGRLARRKTIRAIAFRGGPGQRAIFLFRPGNGNWPIYASFPPRPTPTPPHQPT